MTPLGHRRLILTRHAKSSWDDPLVEDRDRPLNARGRAAALELGDFLASRGLEPEEVLCSSAQRTRETWDQVAAAVIETRPEVNYVESLYHAAPEMMLQVLRTASAPTVMMLGHNPGIAEFAHQLPARPLLDPDFRRYPTCATLIVDFQIDDWSEVMPGQGSVLDFFTPTRRG
ncbi:MAG: histidine phosphatase family protein [Rhodobacteraceae bacterium]|jgi:phosphohistidine phosphatase|uniref:Phosphoglycerate mutase n=1 Tax=Thioclava marina TaxID=1915077 RepID=A0ABX3MT59_9RHOB|nr:MULTISPECIES: histidine phosphatase family protein [Thioclava]TNE93773.1 MAG: histidine phosphatase family protein [Paracoccaceae bacterium]MBD3803927.1 histidine phosphatase family protein [Thioclava sp.]OOY13459.1 phosphoglycerate mutase [Thioclava marina]OOY29174.1 phosphoglycerate mutase [Thioclava sp. L04-15]TNF10700.1 MAG: histidine phosphatase family protein [Paracoccaceae bacterium]